MPTKDWDRNDLEAIRLKTAEKLSWSEMEYSQDGYLVGHGPGRRDIKVVPSYARDVKAAWEIVETLNRKGANVYITNPRKGIAEYEVEIRFPEGTSTRAVHEKVATAICMAFIESPIPLGVAVGSSPSPTVAPAMLSVSVKRREP